MRMLLAAAMAVAAVGLGIALLPIPPELGLTPSIGLTVVAVSLTLLIGISSIMTATSRPATRSLAAVNEDFVLVSRSSVERYARVSEAATQLLAAMDRTMFYDLGAYSGGGRTSPESHLPDDCGLDGDDTGPAVAGNWKLTAGDVRRLREALRS